MSQQLQLGFFVGLLHTYTAQTGRHYRLSHAVSAIVLSLPTCPWGIVINFSLSWTAQGTSNLLGKWFVFGKTLGLTNIVSADTQPYSFLQCCPDLCPKKSQTLSHPWRQKGQHEEMQPWENRPLLLMLPRTVCLSKCHSSACGESWLVLPPIQVMLSLHGSTYIICGT